MLFIEWVLGQQELKSRQLVTHGAILVNGKSVNIPSYLVSPGDIVSVREGARTQMRIQSALTLAHQDLPVVGLKSILQRLLVHLKQHQTEMICHQTLMNS